MPTQIVPIEGIDKLGFIPDMPSVNLPAGAWTDVNNVRFDDGAIRKFKGHLSIFSDDLFTDIQHIAYWENPNTRYYIVINRFLAVTMGNMDPATGMNATADVAAGDIVYTLQLNADATTTVVARTPRLAIPTGTERDFWESVQFNGGFSIVINNGRRTPQDITAQTGTALADTVMFTDLPGWDSYLIGDPPETGATDTRNTAVSVTANIIIAEGNVLLAGGLVERGVVNSVANSVIRNLNSVVRVSDVAAPGTIPQNWNPFRTLELLMRS